MCIGVTPAGAENIVPECLHLKKCIGSRMLAMNQDTHDWLASVELDAFVNRLEQQGIHIQPTNMPTTLQPMTGDAVDHLLQEDILPIMWLGLPEWLQPFIRWIWKMVGQWALSGGSKNMPMTVHKDENIPEGEDHPQSSEEEREEACQCV